MVLAPPSTELWPAEEQDRGGTGRQGDSGECCRQCWNTGLHVYRALAPGRPCSYHDIVYSGAVVHNVLVADRTTFIQCCRSFCITLRDFSILRQPTLWKTAATAECQGRPGFYLNSKYADFVRRRSDSDIPTLHTILHTLPQQEKWFYILIERMRF